MSNSKPLQSVYGFDANNNQIINVAAPIAPTDAVTLEYFDAHAAPNEFTQDGTGAVPRTISDKLKDFVSIKDFGGLGDGVTDCAAALVATGNSTTGGVLIPAGNFVATVTPSNSVSIFALLSRIQIDGTLTLNIATGTHSFTAPIKVFSSGLNVNGLKIIGATPVSLSITSQVSVSGSSGAYSVVLGVSTITNVSVGDFLHTWQVTGTGTPEIHRGIWEITAVDVVNTRITVTNTCRKATFPTNTISTSSSVVLKTILKFANCDAFVVTGSRIDFMNNVAVVGNSDSYWSSSNVSGTEKGTHGITIGSMTVAVNGKPDNANQYGVSPGHVSCGPNVGFTGFDQQGIVTELGGTFWGDFVSACNNKRRGFYASTASGIRAKHISANGNFLDGVISDIGGAVYSSSVSCSVGNGGRGITASQNSTVVFDTGIISHNGLDGAGAVLGGVVQATGARFEYNGSSGVYGDYGGVLVVNDSFMTGNVRYGIDIGFTASARSLNCTINTNSLHGIRATELACAVVTGSTFSGNVSGDKTVRADGMILDGSVYTITSKTATELRVIPTATGQGVRMASTSGGDDCIVGHDTVGTGTFASTLHIRSGNTGIYPDSDNTVILGRSSNRWSTVYAGTGTINTSDAREKTPVRSLNEHELEASKLIGKEIGVYQWLSAVSKKGELAREHIGLTVQRAIEILTGCGLSPFDYGFICYDEWDIPEQIITNDDGTETIIPASKGDRYSFRMDELTLFIAAGFNARLDALES